MNMINDFPPITPAPAPMQGWICPKCGAVMAPSMMWCVNCINGNKVTNGTTETHIDISDWVKSIVYTGSIPEVKLK